MSGRGLRSCQRIAATSIATRGAYLKPIFLRLSSLRVSSCAWIGLAAVALAGCNDSQAAQKLRSLERSGEMNFVCRDFETGEGRPLAACPDQADDGESRHLLAVVTQTLRGEVAVVDFTTGRVLDADPTLPGPSFLPVGGQPTDIVSTPGGMASFVAVAEVGKEGVYALPTICLDAPEEGEAMRDITSWPACALPSAPGKMAIIADPPRPDGTVRGRCDGAAVQDVAEEACSVDLTQEQTIAPAGRRKLMVTMPNLGAVAIIDAQAILNRVAGSFAPCEIEAWLDLSSDWRSETIEQPMPDYRLSGPVASAGAGCELRQTQSYTQPNDRFAANPAGIATAENRLFVADRGAPVIHVLDIEDPCAPDEQPPLVAVSYSHPERLVVTRDVAVSPELSTGKRYLYAVDDSDGSLLVYDVGVDSTSRAPVLRPNAQFMPDEPPDRLLFPAPIRDLTVFKRDVPIPDSATGIALLDTACDPRPTANEPESLYRTSENYSTGARPEKLRGVFVAAALANGDISFVDIEDFDAPCRRPVSASHDAVDQFGCAGDSDSISSYSDGSGFRTVSNEASCNVVEANELRSSSFFANNADVGVRAPTLRYFPRLADEEGFLAGGSDDEGQKHPKMIGVPFSTSGADAESVLHVGNKTYGTASGTDEALVLTPGSAPENSLLLPMREPRAYASYERFAASYEGAIQSGSGTGQLVDGEDLIVDPNVGFCDLGVQDRATAETWAAELGVGEGHRAAFARDHGDYVQLTADFDEELPYWGQSAGRQCAGGRGLRGCEILFGTAEDPTPRRDLMIVEAYQDRLLVESRPDEVNPADPDTSLTDEIRCCFPTATSYVVRGSKQWIVRGTVSGFQHRVQSGADGRCELSCDPTRARSSGRAVEISTSANCSGSCGIGVAQPGDYACTTEETGDQIALGATSFPQSCVFDGPTARFAVYRGGEESRRGMYFGWEVTGGFRALRGNIASSASGTSVLPQAIWHLPQSDRLVVVDGSAGGLSLLSLTTLRLSPSEPYL